MSLVQRKFDANVRTAASNGEIHVAELGPELKDIVGVGIWYGPGQASYSMQLDADPFFSTIPDTLRSWWLGTLIPAAKKFSDDSLGPGFKLRQWYLHLFAVAPEHQRKGIGKAMMSFTEHLAKRDGVSICLEATTEVNVAIYKRMGFEVKGQTTITSRVGESPVFQLMKTP